MVIDQVDEILTPHHNIQETLTDQEVPEVLKAQVDQMFAMDANRRLLRRNQTQDLKVSSSKSQRLIS
jgi:hypothetical protein